MPHTSGNRGTSTRSPEGKARRTARQRINITATGAPSQRAAKHLRTALPGLPPKWQSRILVRAGKIVDTRHQYPEGTRPDPGPAPRPVAYGGVSNVVVIADSLTGPHTQPPAPGSGGVK
jgi:hypothetical protein